MAGFFDKLKQGASKVTDKAQQTVEITRISTQISLKKKEMDKRITLIGEAVFNAYCQDTLLQQESLIGQISEEIVMIQNEILSLELKIKEIKNEKNCMCGKVMPLESKFCPSCGNKFDEPTTSLDVDPSEQEKFDLRCPSCHEYMEKDAKFCGNCGYQVTPYEGGN